MTIPEKINVFLSETPDISIGYAEITFIKPRKLLKGQMGYGVDQKGNSLATGNEGDWQEGWTVIASDQTGDPIFVDLNSPDFMVLCASDGQGAWDPFIIADSFDGFILIISQLRDISKNRTNPVDLEKNPVAAKERKALLDKIKKTNAKTEIWYWEDFFETD